MRDQGKLDYDVDGLFCLMTGGRGHMPNVPIEAYLGDAGIQSGDKVIITTKSGEVIIHTPEQQAIADNDATILELARRMRANDLMLLGQYIVVHCRAFTRRGEITGISWGAVPVLVYSNAGIAGATMNLNDFLREDSQVVLAPTKEEADKMIAGRQAALELTEHPG